jgi:hypothetical protein
MWVKKTNNFDTISELSELNDRISTLNLTIISLESENKKLKEALPYIELLKMKKPQELIQIAIKEYGISQRTINECDNKADIIDEIMYTRRDLKKLSTKEYK